MQAPPVQTLKTYSKKERKLPLSEEGRARFKKIFDGENVKNQLVGYMTLEDVRELAIPSEGIEGFLQDSSGMLGKPETSGSGERGYHPKLVMR